MAPETSTVVVVAPEVLGEALRPLRLGGEDAVARMAESLARHGQLTSLTAFTPAPDRLEIADGFKRLAAARRLEWTTLRVEVLHLDAIQAKAAVALLNQASALSELEEAWVVRSLHRDDHLSQPQIGRLLRRHKAWVCRRLALAEGLDPTVEADVRLGLLSARAGYEVTRLPRGNQREVAEVVVRRGLTVAQTARLVSALLTCTDEVARQALLRAARDGGGAAGAAPSAPRSESGRAARRRHRRHDQAGGAAAGAASGRAGVCLGRARGGACPPGAGRAGASAGRAIAVDCRSPRRETCLRGVIARSWSSNRWSCADRA